MPNLGMTLVPRVAFCCLIQLVLLQAAVTFLLLSWRSWVQTLLIICDILIFSYNSVALKRLTARCICTSKMNCDCDCLVCVLLWLALLDSFHQWCVRESISYVNCSLYPAT